MSIGKSRAKAYVEKATKVTFVDVAGVLLTASELKNRIAVLMGGRASEQLMFDGDLSTGAADDLQRATELAIENMRRSFDSGKCRSQDLPDQAGHIDPQGQSDGGAAISAIRDPTRLAVAFSTISRADRSRSWEEHLQNDQAIAMYP
jgi:peptidase M41-like protein